MGLPAPVGQPLAKPSVTLAFQIFIQACLFLRHLSSCLYSLAVFSQVTNPASTTFLHLLLTWPTSTSQCTACSSRSHSNGANPRPAGRHLRPLCCEHLHGSSGSALVPTGPSSYRAVLSQTVRPTAPPPSPYLNLSIESNCSKDKGTLGLSSKHVVETLTLVTEQSERKPQDEGRQQLRRRQAPSLWLSTAWPRGHPCSSRRENGSQVGPQVSPLSL